MAEIAVDVASLDPDEVLQPGDLDLLGGVLPPYSGPAARWRRVRLPRPCHGCGLPFPAARGDARYCSARCRQRASRAARRAIA